MRTHAVVKLQGKQYIVQEGQKLTVESLKDEKGASIEVLALMFFDEKSEAVEIADKPEYIKAKVIDHILGEKITISRFKAKVRYRNITGFRPKLSTIQIVKL